MIRDRRWLLRAASALVAAAFVGVPAASAATPQQIYNDLRDGKLDGHYSKADLQRALKDASVQGYGSPTVKVRFRPKVTQALGAAGRTRTGVPTVAKRRTLPFTGLDLALLTAGGASLLGLGAGLRRLARAKA